jgi:Transposase DDE domain
MLVLLSMTWCLGDSQAERFGTARAFYVALTPKRRRPGKTVPGFHKALCRIPCKVLRFFAQAIRARLRSVKGVLETDGFKVFGCDGSSLLCPRTDELEKRFTPASGGRRCDKAADGQGAAADGQEATARPMVGASPQVGLSALVHLRSGVLWAWRLGVGNIDERLHLKALLPTLPVGALLVADCGYQSYDMALAMMDANVAFLIRISSMAPVYTVDPSARPDAEASKTANPKAQPLDVAVQQQWVDGEVWYWPLAIQNQGGKPLHLRLLRIRDSRRKVDVWLLTDIRDKERLSVLSAGQIYKMRWGNEGFFRTYKQTLKKVKLSSRTVKLIHREAEGSLLAVAVLLAQGAQARSLFSQKEAASARGLVLAVRAEIDAQLQGRKRGRRGYQKRLAEAVNKQRKRTSRKDKRRWPSRADHTPPKPPTIRVLNDDQKALLENVLQQAGQAAG